MKGKEQQRKVVGLLKNCFNYHLTFKESIFLTHFMTKWNEISRFVICRPPQASFFYSFRNCKPMKKIDYWKETENLQFWFSAFSYSNCNFCQTNKASNLRLDSIESIQTDFQNGVKKLILWSEQSFTQFGKKSSS